MTAAPKLRWFQFSLRRVFKVIAVAAILCAWAVSNMQWISGPTEWLMIAPTALVAMAFWLELASWANKLYGWLRNGAE
jgi:hypothetical protein